jgi:hypothetical protein
MAVIFDGGFKNLRGLVVTTPSAQAGGGTTVDGTRLYTVNRGGPEIYQYTMSTPFDLSTATEDYREGTWSGMGGNTESIEFRTDGSRAYVFNGGGTLFQWDLSTPWDLRTKTSNGSIALTGSGESFWVNDSGTRAWVGRFDNGVVDEYSFGTPWDITTLVSVTPSFNNGQGENSIQAIRFKPDGTKFYLVGNAKDTIYQWDLSTPFDLSTATFVAGSPGGIGGNFSFTLHPEGTSIYILTTDVNQYTLGTPWEVSTINTTSVATLNQSSGAWRGLSLGKT